MPKTNLQKKMAGADWEGFRKAIKKEMVDLNIRGLDPVAKKMEVSAGSLRNWMKDPGQFRLYDFERLMEELQVTEERKDWYIKEALRQIQRAHAASE